MQFYPEASNRIFQRRAWRIYFNHAQKIVFLITLLSCHKSSNRDTEDPNARFYTRDDTEIFFKNVRQSYFDITELKEAKMNIFRWSNQQRQPAEDTTIYLAIIHKWSIDQAHIWIEPSEILNTDPVIFNNGIDSISFDGSSNMNHYEVAEFIYQSIEKNLPTTANGMKIFDSDSDNQNVFRLVMGDYYRLTGIL